MSDAIIVKIDLATPPDEYIKRHLSKQTKETKDRIDKVIQEKKLIDTAKNSLQEKTRQKMKGIDDLFNHLHAQGDSGLSREYILAEMEKLNAAKSLSGVTLKLKTMINKNLVGYKLDVTKTHYRIIKDEI